MTNEAPTLEQLGLGTGAEISRQIRDDASARSGGYQDIFHIAARINCPGQKKAGRTAAVHPLLLRLRLNGRVGVLCVHTC
jgi:hypothetical protein